MGMGKEITKSYAINRIAELNDQIAEMNENQNSTMKYLNKLRDENKQLKQQLEESFTEEDVEGLIEDRNKTIKFLQKELTEKDKEIEDLKQQNIVLENENNKLATTSIIDKYREAQKEVSFGIQLAIQELEKAKINLKDKITMMSNKEHSYLQKVVSWYSICNQINQQIKELRGE